MSSDTGIERDYYASNITVTKKLEVGSTVIDAGQPSNNASYLFAVCHSQAPDFALNDHIKYDTVYSSSSDIVMDTTSPYTSGAGASIGRFTLPANKTFKITTILEKINFGGPSPGGGSVQVNIDTYNLTDDQFVVTPPASNWDFKVHALIIPAQDTVKQYESRIISATTSFFSDIAKLILIVEEIGFSQF